MILKALEVENYRNIPAARFEPGRELTVICGKNGQGKTNLLEAVWLLTGGKSFRGAKDAELIRENAGYAVAEGETQGFGKESRIRVFVGGQPGARKARTVHVNGVDYGRRGQRGGNIHGRCVRPRPPEPREGKSGGTAAFSGCSVMSALSGLCDASAPVFPAGDAKERPFEKLLADAGCERSAGCVRRKAGRERCGCQRKKTGISCAHRAGDHGDIPGHRQRQRNAGHSVRAVFRAGKGPCAVLRESRARDIAAGFCTAGPHREDFSISIDGRRQRFSPARGSSAALCSA